MKEAERGAVELQADLERQGEFRQVWNLTGAGAGCHPFNNE